MKTNNKDVCYYASFNFPAFIWVNGRDTWGKYRELYLKLANVSEISTLKTLSCSIHEIARMLGPELTEKDLLQVADNFLCHGNQEVRLGILKNFHIFLAEVNPTKRSDYIKYITDAFNEAGSFWRTKEMLAKNLGNFASLFDEHIVKEEFLPMFFKFCEDRVAQVCQAAATALAPILTALKDSPEQQKAVIKIVKNNFRIGAKATFKRRQLFLIMCEGVMNQCKELFEAYFKHDMLALVSDKVTNVRITLSRVLKNHFCSLNAPFANDAIVLHAVRVLSKDQSADVLHLINEVQSLSVAHEDDNSSERSSNSAASSTTADMNSFLDSLARCRRSSSVIDTDISSLEQSIM